MKIQTITKEDLKRSRFSLRFNPTGWALKASDVTEGTIYACPSGVQEVFEVPENKWTDAEANGYSITIARRPFYRAKRMKLYYVSVNGLVMLAASRKLLRDFLKLSENHRPKEFYARLTIHKSPAR